MSRLTLEQLRVSSFVATPDAVAEAITGRTECQPVCLSPWCAPTFAASCRCARDGAPADAAKG